MNSFRRLVTSALVVAVATTACNPLASDEADPEVCDESRRRELMRERLAPETPSSPFTRTATDEVWVGLIADSDFSESALFSQPTGVYVLDEGEPVEFTRNDLDFIETGDPYIDFDREGQYTLFGSAPGSYQLWSPKGPEISVVTCR